MSQADKAIRKLDQVRQAWAELELMKKDTSEYESLIKKIRALSAEYQALVDAPSLLEDSEL